MSSNGKPKALDLFCGAGLVADGLMVAGFDVTGVDIDRRLAEWYPADFIHADAAKPPVDLASFDFIWASPPCQPYSGVTPVYSRGDHKQLIDVTRRLLEDHPFTCLENVRTAPVRADLRLTGLAVGLPRLIRERKFELSWLMRWGLQQPELPKPDPKLQYEGHYRSITSSPWIQFRLDKIARGMLDPEAPPMVTKAERREIMGVERAVPDQVLCQGIPPAMAAWIGKVAIDRIKRYGRQSQSQVQSDG